MLSEMSAGIGALVVGLGIGLAAVLGGCLSIGGERESGTFAWQAALPISLRVQWVIKLVTGIVVPLVCMMVVFPLARLLLGPDLVFAWPNATSFLMMLVELLSILALTAFTAFWCASVTKGPIDAALVTLPLAIALASAFFAGAYTANSLVKSGILSSLVARVHPYPVEYFPFIFRYGWLAGSRIALSVAVIPVALIQSYKMFRTPLSAGLRTVVRHGAVLMALALICSFVQSVPFAFMANIEGQSHGLMVGTLAAVRAIPFDETGLKQKPLRISIDQLASTQRMPSEFRSWMGNSDVLITAADSPSRESGGSAVKQSYTITVNLSHGWTCVISDWRAGQSEAKCASGTREWDVLLIH